MYKSKPPNVLPLSSHSNSTGRIPQHRTMEAASFSRVEEGQGSRKLGGGGALSSRTEGHADTQTRCSSWRALGTSLWDLPNHQAGRLLSKLPGSAKDGEVLHSA